METNPNGQAQLAEAALLGAIDALCKGDYLHHIEPDGPVMMGLGRLLARLGEQGVSDLERAVQLSMQASETTIRSVELLDALRTVDRQAQVVAAAAEQMQSSSMEIRSSGERISEEATAALAAADQGTRAVGAAQVAFDQLAASISDNTDKVQELVGLTRRVQDAADVIKEISFQTNLLSLNASVEAARAGEAGAGFAVVASEVRNLASRTASATKEIGAIVRHLEDGMSTIVKSMGQSTAALHTSRNVVAEVNRQMAAIQELASVVTENTERITSTLKEQTAATSDVAEGITEIASSTSQGVGHIDEIVDSLNRIEGFVRGQLEHLSTLQLPDKILYLAKSDHVLWKKRLANMVAGKEGLRAEELADHHSCRLGKWYDSVDDRVRSTPGFGKLVEPHKRVHTQGIRAVELYNKGDIRGALQAMAEVEEASVDVLQWLDDLRERSSPSPAIRLVPHPKR